MTVKSDKVESDKMSAAAREKSKDKKKKSIYENEVLTMRGTIKLNLNHAAIHSGAFGAKIAAG